MFQPENFAVRSQDLSIVLGTMWAVLLGSAEA